MPNNYQQYSSKSKKDKPRKEKQNYNPLAKEPEPIVTYGKVVNASMLNVRKGPSTDDDVLLVVPLDTRVEIISRFKNWTTVKVNDVQGYCMNEYIAYEK